MKIGIVGLPNVGKSTLFNSITKAGAECANYPFCTIEPNVGVVAVPDERIEKLAEIYKPQKVTNAVVEFVDIAGLVKLTSISSSLLYPSSIQPVFLNWLYLYKIISLLDLFLISSFSSSSISL